MSQVAERTCKLTLTIGAVSYAVRPMPTEGTPYAAKVRLRGPDGSEFTVARVSDDIFGAAACDCPSSLLTGRRCEHVNAAMACGLV